MLKDHPARKSPPSTIASVAFARSAGGPLNHAAGAWRSRLRGRLYARASPVQAGELDAATVKASGVVQCPTLIATNVATS